MQNYGVIVSGVRPFRCLLTMVRLGSPYRMSCLFTAPTVGNLNEESVTRAWHIFTLIRTVDQDFSFFPSLHTRHSHPGLAKERESRVATILTRSFFFERLSLLCFSEAWGPRALQLFEGAEICRTSSLLATGIHEQMHCTRHNEQRL